MIELQQWDADAAQSAMAELAEMLHASVAHGASIGFVMPFTLEQAQAFWLGLLPALVRGERAMLVALENGRPSAPCSCCWRCRTTAATGRKWSS
jgi:putative copper export protein